MAISFKSNLDGSGTVSNEGISAINVSGTGTVSFPVNSTGTGNIVLSESPTFSGTATFNTTGAVIIPSGTTAQQPVTPINGMVRMNTTIGRPEWYDSAYGVWTPFALSSADLQTNWNQSTDVYTQNINTQNIINAMEVVLLTPGSESTPVILNSLNYNLLKSGGASNLTGAAGNVMLKIPKFYYSYNYLSSEHIYKVSLTPFENSAIHPAFYRNGVWVDYRYVGIYQAAGWTGTFQQGDGVNSWFSNSTGKLGSVVGYKPLSNISRTNFRAAAARVGTGWSLLDFWTYSMLKLLYITKYGNFNSQTMLGGGNTKFAAWSFATDVSATGKVLSISAPGQSTVGGNSGDYVNFLGIEDIFGSIWQWVDGWNISSGTNYVCANSAHFADDTTTNYTSFGTTNAVTSGWQETLQSNIGFLPATVGGTGSDVAKITDYYYYAAGWVAPLVGGDAVRGSYCGLFCLDALDAASSVDSRIGSRLCF